MLVGLCAKFLGDIRDSAGVQHSAVWWVVGLGWDELLVVVDDAVVAEIVAELPGEGVEETSIDECGWADVDARFLLWKRLVGLQRGRNEARRTCPPEKPTQTTPSSSWRARNLFLIMLVVTIVAVLCIWSGVEYGSDLTSDIYSLRAQSDKGTV